MRHLRLIGQVQHFEADQQIVGQHGDGVEGLVGNQVRTRWMMQVQSAQDFAEGFGAMVPRDGSHHDWFEGRRGKGVLMVMVDDATNRLRARFSEEETNRASYVVFEGWGRKHRLPGGLYVDRDSIYPCEGAASVTDQLAGKARQTQFGRAMAALGVELIWPTARKPKAGWNG